MLYRRNSVRRLKNKGFLVVFEGATGSGKSFFVNKLSKHLYNNYSISIKRIGGFLDKDDEDTPEITKALRRMMEAFRFIGLPWLCETTILLSEQAFNLEEIVMPAYEQGRVIFYENYNDALIAYQLMRGLELNVSQKKLLSVLEDLVNLQHQPFGYPIPDLTVYIATPITTIINQLESRDGKKVTKRDKNMIQTVIQNYSNMYNNNNRIIQINNDTESNLKRNCSSVAKLIAEKYEKK